MITNTETGTNIQQIADGIYRINTPAPLPDGQAFSFNQYLLVDNAPLLFHTGPRQLFPLVRDAVAAVLPVKRLRYVGLSHVEADECGSLNQWLALAPQAQPLCSQVAAMVSVGDLFTQGGRGEVALTQSDILRPSEDFRQAMDYYAHAPHTGAVLRRLAEQQPKTLACMHGSAWQGDGGMVLRQLAEVLGAH